MQFSSVLLAAVAFALSNAVQFTNTASSFVGITVGKGVNLTWSDASGPVTLLLKNGDPNNLQTVSTIASGLTTTSYIWTPASSLANGEYALEIEDSTATPNYSQQFALTGGSASVSSSASGSSSSGSTLTTSASTTTTTGFSNSTTTSVTKSGPSATKASTTGSSTSTGTSTPNTNSAASFASPLAFVFLAFTAMMTIN